MSLDATIDKIRVHVAGLTGLARVYSDPPDSMQEFPCAIVIANRGAYELSAAGGRAFHVIVVEIHSARQVLPQAVDEAKVWPDRMYTKLAAATDLDINGQITYRAGGIQYGNDVHYAVRFEVPCKVNL
ncbi:MAG: hypothetical protein IPM06_19515 [Rhizobiales bacterium]|nr:hypothetical protein [Hyphomicrobiales bacterium]